MWLVTEDFVRPPEKPSSESARLQALATYEVLDTDDEPAFDGLTTLVAHLLDVPIALVSLVDAERQWFKSRYGLEVRETSREVSFCGHVVARDAALIVEDTLNDAIFVDNPLVTSEPRIRFYAGQPLRSPDGYVLGTLCAIDRRPRELSAKQQELLALLAAQVVDQLELRRKGRLLQVQRNFFDLSVDLLCTADQTMTVREVNPGWERVLGVDLDQLRGRTMQELVHPEDQERARQIGAQLQRSTEPVSTEARVQHRDGHWIALEWSAVFRGGVYYCAARDITARKAKDAALSESQRMLSASEARLNALFEGMAEGVVVQDRGAAITSSNPAAERILGLSGDQLAGRTSIDPRWHAVHPDGTPFPGETHPAVVTLRTGVAQRNVVMGVQGLTPTRWISINTQPLPHDDPGDAVIVTFRDITEQVQVEEELAKERTFLQAVLFKMPETLVLVFDAALRIERSFGGPEPLVGRDIGVLSDGDPQAVEQAARRALSGERSRLEVSRGGRHYEVRAAPLSSEPGTGLMVAHDVTERDGLRERLTRQERLVTTGTLVAGVGHEINNPLSFVMANLDLALDELRAIGGPSPSSRVKDLLDMLAEAREGAERIRKIVRGLRAFAREDAAPSTVELASAFDLAASLSLHEMRHRATLTIDVADVGSVFVDEGRLSQVLVNLLVNAAQAFVRPDPGRNRVVARARRIPGWVVVEVEDNGPGIEPAVLPRIFDPFFTTKPVGQGTGLGLSISHNLVLAFGGQLTCHPSPSGTTFRFTIPDAVEPTGSPAPPDRAPTEPRGTILVVDDEVPVLRAVTRLLSGQHEVVGLSDPREALARLTRPASDFDLVLCDLMMPHLDGMTLFRQVRAVRPELAERFVFVTGGITHDDIRAFLDGVPNERLEKPFSTQNLRGIARRFVSGRRPA